jgi:predicted permease
MKGTTMADIREWIVRLWGAVRGNPRDADMEEELRLHLELATEDMQRRMGATEEAARSARLRAGGVSQAMEALRDQRGLPWLSDLAQDLRHGLRMVRRTPAFTAIACLTLALGIGANTAVFSLVNVLLWRDLPVRDPGSLVQLTWQYPGDPPQHSFRTQDYERFRDHNDVFSDVIGTAPVVVDSGPAAEPLATEWVTGNFFAALGVRPALGRLLEPPDGQPGTEPVAVVSWTYWQNRLDMDPGVLGTRISVAGVTAGIVGVTAREFSGVFTGYRTDVWMPAAAAPPGSRQSAGFMLLARLEEGVPVHRAAAQMRVLDRPRIEQFGRSDPQWLTVTLDVEPARSGFSTPLHQQFGRPLLVGMTIVAALLLLTCANIGSLLLARATARVREMAVRASLGASRSRIMRQVLAESLLLSSVGSVLGLAGAYVGANALVRIMASGTRLIGAQPQLDVPIDGNVLSFTVAVTVAAAVLFGLAPAWIAFVSAPASAMRAGSGTSPSRTGRLAANGLVVAQVAVSLVLLSVAGLYVQHLSDLRNRELGFDRTSVLIVGVDTGPDTRDRGQLAAVYRELLERFEGIPGVHSATVSGMTPISGAAASRFVTVDGFEEPTGSRRRVMLNGVAPRFFETFGTSFVSGRDFRHADARQARVAIVNQAMARHYFAGRDPIGRQLVLEGESQPYHIVGVVSDAKYADLRRAAPPTVYLDAFQQARLPSEFALRTVVPPGAVVADVRRVVADSLRGGSIRKVTTLSEQLDISIVPERLTAAVSAFFGAAGALLAAIGLYGVLAYTVARRTSEIGVRIALGATRKDVTLLVMKQGLFLMIVGLCVGGPLALWSRRIAASTLEGMSGESLLPLVAAAGTMVGVALLAVLVPVRRALRVEPMVALRSE